MSKPELSAEKKAELDTLVDVIDMAVTSALEMAFKRINRDVENGIGIRIAMKNAENEARLWREKNESIAH